MNYETASAEFRAFFEAYLAPIGFVLSTPAVAERTLTDLRQVVCWSLSSHGYASAFDLDVYWAYAHELDDAPPNAPLGNSGEPACSGRMGAIRAFDLLSERDIACRLDQIVSKGFLPFLEATKSAAQVFAAVKKDESLGIGYWGTNPMVRALNAAFCEEIAGSKRGAAFDYYYLSMDDKVQSPLAARLRAVARKRGDALYAKLSEGTATHRIDSPVDVAAITPDATRHISEAELATKCVPVHMKANATLPRHFTEAIAQQFAPSTSFWCGIDAERFATEAKRQNPQFMKALAASWKKSGCGSFHDDLVNEIRTQQFDEFCARWLSSLPPDQIPDDNQQIYELLHLCRTGESTHLGYLELDGVKAVPHIRAKMAAMLG